MDGPCAPAGGVFYGSADFLYAAGQGVYVPPLVTLAPPGTFPTVAGSLYRPNTLTEFGGVRLGQNFRPGFKFNVGYWLDSARTHAFDAGFFFLGTLSEYYNGATAPGGVILARPFVNATTGSNVAQSFGIAGPGMIAASFGTSFYSGDVNYRRGILPDGTCDLLVGFRYLHLGDSLNVYAAQGFDAPGPVSAFGTSDSFRTRNNFYGPQIGFATHCKLPWRCSLDVLTKVGLGVTVADSDLAGSTASNLGVGPGLLVGPTNAGSRSTSSFAVVPEVGLKLGCDLTEALRFTVGYTFVYWSRVQRAPDHVDLTVAGPNRPAFPNAGTDFWVQGWSLGLAWKY